MYLGRKQDIEATINLLKRYRRFAKLISFILLWYPFKGSVEQHIFYLENLIRS